MNLRHLPLFILLLMTPASSMAAVLSLSDAVHEGVENSPVVKKAESVKNEASWKKRETLSGFLPSISATANYLTETRYVYTDIEVGGNPASVPQIVPTGNLILNAQLPLFEGGAGIHRYAAGRALESAADHEYRRTLFKTSREILLRYYKVLAAVTLKEVAEQNSKALDDHLRDVRLFKKAGAATNFDVLQVEVKASEAESEILNATDNIQVARMELNSTLGLEHDDRTIAGSLPQLSADTIAGKKVDSFQERDDIQALSDRVNAYRHLDSATGRYWVPKISLFGQYQYYNNKSDDVGASEDYRDAYQVGFQLTWNLFDGLASISRAEQSEEQNYQWQRDLQIAKLNSTKDLELWRRKFLYQCSVFKSRQNDVAKSTESVRLATQGRKVGSRTNSDLLDAENELFRSRAAMVNAQIGAVEALINLEFAVGHELHSFF